MRKLLFTIITVILLTVNASAQYKPFYFGLKVEPGISWAKLNTDNMYDGKTKMMFNWGFVGNIYFVENYGLSTGFNVKFLNNEYSFSTDENEHITRKIKNQYIEIPLGMIMRTEKIGDVRIMGNVGYGLGFLLNTVEKNFDSDLQELTSTDNHSYNKLRHALIVKLGVEYYVHKSSCLVAALVFNNNFTNIYTERSEQNIFMNNLCLEIGFMF